MTNTCSLALIMSALMAVSTGCANLRSDVCARHLASVPPPTAPDVTVIHSGGLFTSPKTIVRPVVDEVTLRQAVLECGGLQRQLSIVAASVMSTAQVKDFSLTNSYGNPTETSTDDDLRKSVV